jgi:hypothetical protein
MDIIKITNIITTANGIDVSGTYDVGSEDVIGLRVKYRLNEENKGNVVGAVAGPNNVIRITSRDHHLHSGDRITVFGVRGTVEANGDWWVREVSRDMFDLRNSVFQNNYTSHGEWFISSSIAMLKPIDGNPPPTSWTISINLTRSGYYDVRAVLYWTGSPTIIGTAPSSILFPYT